MNIVVLISGNGSNLQAIIDACKEKKINGTLRAVFSNKADAFGLERARKAAIPAHTLTADQFSSREAFDRELILEIDAYAPDVVVLAGFMRILSPAFVAHYNGRLLNIHPSLLPKYPGLHTHRQALENGDEEHGTSVHFVTDELDGGPVILQSKVPVFEGDDEDEITARVQVQEHAIYPLVGNQAFALVVIELRIIVRRFSGKRHVVAEADVIHTAFRQGDPIFLSNIEVKLAARKIVEDMLRIFSPDMHIGKPVATVHGIHRHHHIVRRAGQWVDRTHGDHAADL